MKQLRDYLGRTIAEINNVVNIPQCRKGNLYDEVCKEIRDRLTTATGYQWSIDWNRNGNSKTRILRVTDNNSKCSKSILFDVYIEKGETQRGWLNDIQYYKLKEVLLHKNNFDLDRTLEEIFAEMNQAKVQAIQAKADKLPQKAQEVIDMLMIMAGQAENHEHIEFDKWTFTRLIDQYNEAVDADKNCYVENRYLLVEKA